MTIMMPVKLKCALCGALNECYVLTNTNSFDGMDTEFRPYAAGSEPLEGHLQTCSECGYTHYNIENMPKNIIETTDLVKRFNCAETFQEKPLPLYKRYELVGRILILDRAMPEKIAGTFLRAAWSAEDNKKTALAKSYRKEAANLLSKSVAYSKTATRITSEQLFFLAEIYRRAGEFKLSEEIHKKIKTEELHSDLQKALTQIKYLMADGDSRKVMLEDV